MTNSNPPFYNIMNVGEGQDPRKRKASETNTSSTSCSSLDSDLEESEARNKALRKVARVDHHRRYTNVCRYSENNLADDQPSSSSSKQGLSTASESEDSEKCPICLKTIKSQVLGITDTCNHHTFCLTCLEEWSKSKRTCPVDRKEFKSILVLDSMGNVSRQLPVRATNLEPPHWYPAYETATCEVCGNLTNEEIMLTCDGCGMGYHLTCLAPPMETFPTGIWLCNDCWYYYND